MPIYEFACQDCGHEFEKIQSFSDSSTPACPNCQGRHVQRRLSAPAIHFKGSGWYITDSKKAAKTSATGSSGGGGADSEPGSDKSDAGTGETGKGEPVKSDAPSVSPPASPSAAPASAKAVD